MTARMLLSLFLDFFRCRKPIWRHATSSCPDPGSTWSLGQIMDAPVTDKSEKPATISSDSDYDSAANLDTSNENSKHNINEKTAKSEDDGDDVDDGFDDPRLPEMII
ncbi:hypothetical protein KR044_009208 [Drosophila immigrans]|nr:hypothetical protein KR044_009208 [Drosophila immigrans]